MDVIFLVNELLIDHSSSKKVLRIKEHSEVTKEDKIL